MSVKPKPKWSPLTSTPRKVITKCSTPTRVSVSLLLGRNSEGSERRRMTRTRMTNRNKEVAERRTNSPHRCGGLPALKQKLQEEQEIPSQFTKCTVRGLPCNNHVNLRGVGASLPPRPSSPRVCGPHRPHQERTTNQTILHQGIVLRQHSKTPR